MPDHLTYHQEVYRKFIHISSSSIAILLWYFGRDLLLPWILVVAILFPIIDYSRQYNKLLNKLYLNLFGIITRSNEYHGISGASWVFIGAGTTAYLFNEKAAVIALLIMSFSDSAAAIIGIKYGATRLFNKSLEGSMAFFIITYAIIFFLSPASIILTLIGTISATVIELFSSSRLNDNILIPLGVALILTLGGIS